MKEQNFSFSEDGKKVKLQIGDKFSIKSTEDFSDYSDVFAPYPNDSQLENVNPEFSIILGINAPLKLTLNTILRFIKPEKTDELQFGNCDNQNYHTFLRQ